MVAHGRVNAGAEEDFGVFVEVTFIQFAHEVLDFGESGMRTAADVHEDAAGFVAQFAFVEQRAFEGGGEGFGDAVGAFGRAMTEQAAGISGADSGDQFIEPDPDQARGGDEIDDGPDALADDFIGGGEGFVDSFFGKHDLTHAIVVKSHKGVGLGAERGQSLLGLTQSAASFEGERHHSKDHDKGSFGASHAGDHWGGSGAGTATQACAQKHHFLALDFFADGVLAGADGFGSEIGVTASAKAAGEFGAELELHAEHGALQGSGIGIQRDQLGAGQPLESDGVENVGARPT